jgi:hypothetical protein
MNGVVMNTFTIDTDNNITAYAGIPTNADAESFSTEKELEKLTADWPMSRIVEIWNSFAGVAPFADLKPVKKFTDRASAVGRLWKACQRLPAEPLPDAAAKDSSRSSKKGTSKSANKQPSGGLPTGNKKADVLALLHRPEGATLGDIMKATGWQAHTVRGFISGTLKAKMNLEVESSRSESKERTYRVKA